MNRRNIVIVFISQVRLQELLKYPSHTKTKNVKVTIRQLLPGPGNDYRYVVKLRQGSGKDRQGMAVKAKGLKA